MVIEYQTVVRFFNSLNSRDLEEMGQAFTDSTAFFFPKTQPLIGRDRILRFFRILFRKYPELSFRILRTIIQDNQAAVHWANQGVSNKGETYENEGVTIFEEEDGMIRFMSDFFKDTERF